VRSGAEALHITIAAAGKQIQTVKHIHESMESRLRLARHFNLWAAAALLMVAGQGWGQYQGGTGKAQPSVTPYAGQGSSGTFPARRVSAALICLPP